MPTSLFNFAPRSSFTKFKLTLFLLLSPLIFYAQTLTGLWIGAVSNDSTTVRKDQSFEIALTEYRGKVYGYSRSEFIVEDVLYYVVKRVKGTINGDVCEVTDDEIIAFNFPTKLDKGVKVTSVFRRNGSDSAWYLDGTWKTNKTKNFYSVTGKISLAEEKDLSASRIFPHLEELKMADEVAFYKERKVGAPIVKLVKPERDDKVSYVNVSLPQASAIPVAEKGFTQSTLRSEKNAKNSQPRNDEETKSAVVVSNTEEKNPDVASLPTGDVARKNSTTIEEPIEKEKKIASTYTEVSPAPGINTKTNNNPNVAAKNGFPQRRNEQRGDEEETKTSMAVNKSEEKNPDVASPTRSAVARNENVAGSEPQPRNETVTRSEPQPEYVDDMNVDLKKLRQSQAPVQQVQQPAIKPTAQKQTTGVKLPAKKEESIVVAPIPKVKTTPAKRNGAAFAVNDRRTEVSQVVNFKSDSLQIALYDNGQIDGDTVSVLMNGQVIMSKQGLKATATRHTIYLNPGDEEFHIVLYAENLGSLPPNTGLLVVRDGADVYNLRFSSDFQKNTGIVFRRKQ